MLAALVGQRGQRRPVMDTLSAVRVALATEVCISRRGRGRATVAGGGQVANVSGLLAGKTRGRSPAMTHRGRTAPRQGEGQAPSSVARVAG